MALVDWRAAVYGIYGARLTLSEDMKEAQAWAMEEMKRIGLANVAAEPFMDFGAAWDNEYVSLHMLEPDYQPMVGYPIAHTLGACVKIRIWSAAFRCCDRSPTA